MRFLSLFCVPFSRREMSSSDSDSEDNALSLHLESLNVKQEATRGRIRPRADSPPAPSSRRQRQLPPSPGRRRGGAAAERRDAPRRHAEAREDEAKEEENPDEGEPPDEPEYVDLGKVDLTVFQPNPLYVPYMEDDFCVDCHIAQSMKQKESSPLLAEWHRLYKEHWCYMNPYEFVRMMMDFYWDKMRPHMVDMYGEPYKDGPMPSPRMILQHPTRCMFSPAFFREVLARRLSYIALTWAERGVMVKTRARGEYVDCGSAVQLGKFLKGIMPILDSVNAHRPDGLYTFR